MQQPLTKDGIREPVVRRRTLDQFDRAILRIVQKDNQTPQRAIAERVHLSAPSVQRRIAAMEAAGIIIANVAVVSPDALLGAITVIVEVHLQNDRSTLVEPAKVLFSDVPEVQQCYYVAGNGGFILMMIVPDMKRYETLARRLFADNEIVATYRTLVVLDRVKTSLTIDIPDPN